MKIMKYLTIGILFIGMVALMGCKKDYICSCTFPGNNVNTYPIQYNDITKKEATENCNDLTKEILDSGLAAGASCKAVTR